MQKLPLLYSVSLQIPESQGASWGVSASALLRWGQVILLRGGATWCKMIG